MVGQPIAPRPSNKPRKGKRTRRYEVRRITILVIAALVAALLAAAPGANAKVELASGSTTLKLAKRTATALQANGVSDQVRPMSTPAWSSDPPTPTPPCVST